jgi:hypothetical protein
MTWLEGFLGLVRITFDASTPALPLSALALLGLLLLGFEEMRRRREWTIPSQLSLASLVVVPLLLSLGGAVWFAADEGASGDNWTWRSLLLTALAIAQLPLSIWVVYRLRKWPWAAVPTALASILWTAVAWFVSGMALANDWL